MPFQFSPAVRNNWLDSIETTIGASPVLRIRSGPVPASTAAARTGTVLATMTLPADFLAAASGGSKSLSGVWQEPAADATGTAGHFEIADSTGTTVHLQGTCGALVAIPTSAATAATDAVLTFASTAGVVLGQRVSGTGIPAGTFVIDTTATTVSLSQASLTGVASGATITFESDMTIDNTSIAVGQQVTVTAFSLTASGA